MDIQRSLMKLKLINNSNDFHREIVNGKTPFECNLVPDLPICFKVYCGGEIAPCSIHLKYLSKEGDLRAYSSLTEKEPTAENYS